MKKLIFLIAMAPFLVFSQGSNVAYKQFVTNAVCTTDSSFTVTVSDNYCWQLLINWSANDGTTATIKIQQTIDGVTWSDYAGISAVTVTGATGSQAFEDDMLTGNKIRVLFTHQAGKTCTLDCYYNFKRR